MIKSRRLVIIGDSLFAQIAYEYFQRDSPFEVCGFAVERAYLKKESLFNLPVIPFEDLAQRFPPDSYSVFVAITYIERNRVRARLYEEVKKQGYSIATYISPHAFVWDNSKIGENCFIFENNTVQPWVTIEDDVILWSGNHIGHHSVVRRHVFISSQVVVSGVCDIGEYCFLGVNSTIVDNTHIASDVVLGAGTVVIHDITQPGTYVGNPARLLR
ncbi:MAG: acetyltransferase [Conexivisphaerales archaeon]